MDPPVLISPMAKRRFPRSSSSPRLLKSLLAVVVFITGSTVSYFFNKKESVPAARSPISTSQPSSAEISLTTVTKIIDGDTLELANKEHVRLIGIDTPESKRNAKAKKDSGRTGMDIEKIVTLGKKAKNFPSTLF